MGRYTLIELSWLGAGLVVAVAIIWVAAWAYPPGRDVIRVVGGVAMLIGSFIALRPLREARAKDRAAAQTRG